MGKSLIHRRESIIVSTIEMLNQVGLQNLSTKLIARQEGVSEGTLFRHFKNKAEILAAVIEQFGQFDNAIMETCQRKNMSPIESLRYFFNAYAEYYENYREITVITQLYDSLMNEEGLAEKIKDISFRREQFIIAVLREAQKKKELKMDANPERIEELLIGGHREICLKWRMEQYSFSIKERSAEMIETLIQAFTE